MKQLLPIPLSTKAYKNSDSIELTEEAISFYDGFVTDKGGMRVRPSLTSIDLLLSTSGIAGCTGMYYWGAQECLIITTSAGAVWKASYSTFQQEFTSVTDLTLGATGGAALEATTAKVYFAEEWDGSKLYMANGGSIIYSNGVTVSEVTDADAPTQVKQIAFIDTYLLAITGADNKFYFSSPTDGTTWDAVDFASAVRSPDNIIAIRVFQSDIYLIGEKTVEIWRNDGTTPFSSVSGGFIERGCSAPDSVVVTDDGLYWLDDYGYPAKFNGGTLERLPFDYAREIRDMDTYSDCVAERIEIAGKFFILYTFPTENRSLVFDLALMQWYEWRTSEEESPGVDLQRFRGQYFAFCPLNNTSYMADGRAPSFYILDAGTSQSPQDDIYSKDILGQSHIVNVFCERITGHISFGAHNLKRGGYLLLRAKRGEYYPAEASGEDELFFSIDINDDNKGWRNSKVIPLGFLGDREIIKKIYIGGTFRTRQYKFSMSNSTVVGVVAEAFQEVEVLNR